MSDNWRFATFRLALLTPIHVGSWRSGMVAQTHRFVPGHVLSYALTASLGSKRGGEYKDYEQALRHVLECVKFAPAFLTADDRLLYPSINKQVIEQLYIRGNNHATLQLDSGSAQDKALFELEYISAGCMGNTQQYQSTQLLGACWYTTESLDGLTWSQWFDELRLGGESKTGYGRVKLMAWHEKASSFHGLGSLNERGLVFKAGERLPGPALSGVGGTPIQPWLGRLYDKDQGFGRRLNSTAFVAMDGICLQEATFLPHSDEIGLGCWSVV